MRCRTLNWVPAGAPTGIKSDKMLFSPIQSAGECAGIVSPIREGKKWHWWHNSLMLAVWWGAKLTCGAYRWWILQLINDRWYNSSLNYQLQPDIILYALGNWEKFLPVRDANLWLPTCELVPYATTPFNANHKYLLFIIIAVVESKKKDCHVRQGKIIITW